MINPRPIETAILICSLFCLPRIVIPGRPVPDIPQIMVRIPAAGLSAQQVHSSMQGIVEEELLTSSEQIQLESVSAPAELLLAVKFPRGTATLGCISRVQQLMSRVQNRLPYQAARPIITPLPSEPPFLKLFFSLTSQSEALRNLELSQIQEQLQRNPNIQRVTVHGYSPRRIVIRLDPEKLSRLHISPLYIQQYLQQSLFHFYSGSRQQGHREIGVEMKSSIADIAELKQMALPIPQSSAGYKHLIRLQEVAAVEWQNLGPSHFIAAAGFPYTVRDGSNRVAGIFIQTSHSLQIFQQIKLFRFIRKTLGGTDAVEDIIFSGGIYFSVIATGILLCVFFAAGLLLCASLTSTTTSPDNDTICLYMLSWALMLGGHTVFQIPISPSRCIGICIAVPGIITVLAAGSRPWKKQLVGLCAITPAAAVLIIGLGIALDSFVDGALQQGIRNSLPFHSPLLTALPSGVLFSSAALASTQVVQDLGCFLFWGILLSGLPRAAYNCSSPAHILHPLEPLLNRLPLFILIALLSIPLLTLPRPHSYSLQTTLHPQHACLALNAYFRSQFRRRFPTASITAEVPQYSQIEQCSTAAEYWQLRRNPQQISINCLMSPLTALRSLKGRTELRDFAGVAGLRGLEGGQSTLPSRFNLKIKQKDSPFAVVSRRELYSHLQLSVRGNKIGSLPDSRSVSARAPVHLFYGRSGAFNELAALPIFIGNDSVPLGELCEITSTMKSEAE
ncbi:MAG: efflux RND transporter permease subunit [Spirochaetaceae bacterium]|nr:efflux RND transporter permease subunit [Spirochaetaceae bacterium]MCF7950754.1 efflux RND transporter permease subunit [Spirochaetaceae bacterium]